MYTADDDFTYVNNIVYKYLCINELYTSKSESWEGWEVFLKRNGRKSTVCFPLHIQSLS